MRGSGAADRGRQHGLPGAPGLLGETGAGAAALGHGTGAARIARGVSCGTARGSASRLTECSSPAPDPWPCGWAAKRLQACRVAPAAPRERAMHNETGGSGHRSPHMQHDAIHKLLCSFPRVIADILRGYLGVSHIGVSPSCAMHHDVSI